MNLAQYFIEQNIPENKFLNDADLMKTYQSSLAASKQQ